MNFELISLPGDIKCECVNAFSSSQVPQLDRGPEAPWPVSHLHSFFIPPAWWRSATRPPSPGKHLQPLSHHLLSTGVLTLADSISDTTGPYHSQQAQACTTLLCQHRHSTPEQVRTVWRFNQDKLYTRCSHTFLDKCILFLGKKVIRIQFMTVRRVKYELIIWKGRRVRSNLTSQASFSLE